MGQVYQPLRLPQAAAWTRLQNAINPASPATGQQSSGRILSPHHNRKGRTMKVIALGLGILASAAIAAPAFALERDGTIHFTSRLGSGTSTFSQSYDPGSGGFSRTGKIKMANGRMVTYSLSGTCDAAQQTCDFTGTATGPFGGKWRANGNVKHEADGVHFVGELTAPDGKVTDFDRHAGDRDQLLQKLLQ